MAYVRLVESKPELIGYWLPKGGAVLVKTRGSAKYRRDVPRNGLVTFIEAAALLRRRGKPVSRIAVYEWAKNGKLRYEHITPRPGVRQVALIRISTLRKFGERNGFELLPLEISPPDER